MKLGSQLKSTHKEILLYGFCIAVLVLLLKSLEAKFIVFQYRLDLFIGAIAIVFTVLGVWLAQKLSHPRVETRIIEREVFIGQPVPLEKEIYPVLPSGISQQAIDQAGISKRELEVLNLMATGLSNEEIAAGLFVSINTVKTHLSNIFVKLDVKRRTQAVEKAKRLSIIA